MKLAAKEAFKARLAAIRQQVMSIARRAEVVDHFDVDGDDGLSDAEKLALKQAIQQRVAEGRDAE